jgi:hypothetical protein
MSTPQQAPTPKAKKARALPKLYIFNNKEFTSTTALLNHLIGLNLLQVKDRIIVCQYCGAKLLPINEAAHYFSQHRDKLQFK